MIVTSEFAGDENQTLMDIQHAMYGEMVVWLFVVPRDRYMAASRLLRPEDDLSKRLSTMDGFDHRALQLAHDRIAAYYRFNSPGEAQLRLGEEEGAYRQRLKEGWRDFFTQEVAAFTLDDEFTRAICTHAEISTARMGHRQL